MGQIYTNSGINVINDAPLVKYMNFSFSFPIVINHRQEQRRCYKSHNAAEQKGRGEFVNGGKAMREREEKVQHHHKVVS